MADFFDNQNVEETATEEPSKIKLGDKEYTQEELDNLVGMGQKALEYEKRYNTDFDNAWKAYGKTTNKVKELEQKLASYETQMQQKQEPQLPVDQELARRQALEQAKELGLVTKEDFKNYLEREFRPFYQQERMAERLLDESTSLEKKYDGSDGRPKFQTDDVLDYMSEYGIRNPEAAYKLMYEEELDSWKQKQLNKAKTRGIDVQSTSNLGSRQPKDVRPTKDNFDSLLQEALYGPTE